MNFRGPKTNDSFSNRTQNYFLSLHADLEKLIFMHVLWLKIDIAFFQHTDLEKRIFMSVLWLKIDIAVFFQHTDLEKLSFMHVLWLKINIAVFSLAC